MEGTVGRVLGPGLSPDTTGATLMAYFSRFGGVADSCIIMDNSTGCSKGYGFMSFVDSSVAKHVLDIGEHTILGKKVVVKQATPKRQRDQSQEHNNNDNGASNIRSCLGNKIFVGGLPHNLTTEQFRTHFAKYGLVKDATLKHDRYGNPRGFGFITFQSEITASDVLRERHELNNKSVDVKWAKPKERMVCGQLDKFDCNSTRFAYQQRSFGSYGPVRRTSDPYRTELPYNQRSLYPEQSSFHNVSQYQNPRSGSGYGNAPPFNGYWGASASHSANSVIHSGTHHPLGTRNLVGQRTSYGTGLPNNQGSFYSGQSSFHNVSLYQNPLFGSGYGDAPPLNGYWDAYASYSVDSVIHSGTHHPLGTRNLVGEHTSDDVVGNVAMNAVLPTDARAGVPVLYSDENNQAEADENLALLLPDSLF